MNHLVSIVMPCYNSSKYLSNSINSVLNQTYKHFELIIIDDFSKDNSLAIIREFALIDKRIKLISLKENKGVANARNIGIDYASGRFISFLDSDDYWIKNKLEIQIAFMIKENSSFSFSNVSIFNETNRSNYNPKESNSIKFITFKDLLNQNFIATSSVVIDLHKIRKFHMPLMKSGQDYATWLLILKTGHIAHYLKKNLVVYTIRKNSLSRNKFKTIFQVFFVHRKFLQSTLIVSIFFTSLFTINTLMRKLYIKMNINK